MNERITVELDAEVLAAARKAGLDLSDLLDRAVRRHLPLLSPTERDKAARQWYEDNKAAIDAYNEMIESDGFVFSDGARTF